MSALPAQPATIDAPLGVFDSGIGGLSVLRHIQQALPAEDLLYFADTGYAPYGDRSDGEIVARSLAIAAFLVERQVKALVVACNTATAAAIEAIRAQYPQLVVIGVEPGLKPAALRSQAKVVGVFATRSTAASARFIALRDQIAASTGVRFVTQACVGLADQIEKGALHAPATVQLLRQYLTPVLREGADTLVLGCTHYPFVMDAIAALAAAENAASLHIIDTGEAVARHLARQLEGRHLLRPARSNGALSAFTTGSASTLAAAFAMLLKLDPPVQAIAG